MIRCRLMALVFLATLAIPSFAVAPIPIIYTAFRIGTQSYALSQLAEVGQSLIGQSIKQLDASLSPITSTTEGAASGLRIPLTSAADSVVPAPTGAAQTVSVGYVCSAVGGGPWEQAGCIGNTVTTAAGLVGSTCTYHVVKTSSNCPFPPYQQTYDTTAPASVACPSGYTQNGSLCNLTNPRQASPDGKVDYERTAQTFAKYAGEESNSMESWLSQQTITSANDRITISGLTPQNQPQQFAVTNTSDGGSVLTSSVQRVDGSGATYVQTTALTINPTGVATSAVVTNQAQQMVQTAGANTWTVSSAPVATFTPAATSGSSSTFPSDYARQGEAASAAASINATLGLKLDKLVETSPAPADLVTPDPSGYTDFGTTFQSLLGWQLPGHTSQCPTASFNTPWSTAYTIDSHCQLITNHWGALQAAMAVVWTIVALFIVLRA